LNYSAIILSGGSSKRFGRNKSLAKLIGKPMITYVVDSVAPFVDEVIVTTDKEDNRSELSKILDPSVKILLDEYEPKSPVIGSLTGFKNARGKHSILLACDTPLLSSEVTSLLLELSEDYDAVIPRWPNGYIEPLQATYDTRKAYEASLETVNHGELKMSAIIARLRRVLYLSTIALSKFDPKLNTFLNVNTPDELLRIERILRTDRRQR